LPGQRKLETMGEDAAAYLIELTVQRGKQR